MKKVITALLLAAGLLFNTAVNAEEPNRTIKADIQSIRIPKCYFVHNI